MIPLIRALIAKLELYIQPGSFLCNLVVLGSGTALAQLIPVLASPILTRVYSPEDFGMFAVFMALIGTFTPIICGKYEVALVLPENRVHAEHLLGISLYFAIGISGLLFLAFLSAGNSLLSLLHASRLSSWIFSVPLALLFTGFFTAATYFANRNKQYKLLSKARVFRSLIMATVGIFTGVCGAGFGGLLAGFFAGISVTSFLLLYQNRAVFGRRVFSWNRSKRLLLYRYCHFPIYNATTSLLNGLTLNLPIFFLSRYFANNVVGYYAIVDRITSAPTSFISASVSQINLKKVVDLVNAGKPVTPYLLKLTGLLFSIILIPAVIIMLYGPKLFTVVFGKSWEIAGEYARILMPGIAVRFVVSTLSSTFGATNNNKAGAFAKILVFLSTLAICIFFAYGDNIQTILYALMLNNVILYIIILALIYWSAQRPNR